MGGLPTSIGYLFGSHIDAIYSTATSYDAYLAIGIGALIVLSACGRKQPWGGGRSRSAADRPIQQREQLDEVPLGRRLIVGRGVAHRVAVGGALVKL